MSALNITTGKGFVVLSTDSMARDPDTNAEKPFDVVKISHLKGAGLVAMYRGTMVHMEIWEELLQITNADMAKVIEQGPLWHDRLVSILEGLDNPHAKHFEIATAGMVDGVPRCFYTAHGTTADLTTGERTGETADRIALVLEGEPGHRATPPPQYRSPEFESLYWPALADVEAAKRLHELILEQQAVDYAIVGGAFYMVAAITPDGIEVSEHRFRDAPPPSEFTVTVDWESIERFGAAETGESAH